jgi:hypothetical protein
MKMKFIKNLRELKSRTKFFQGVIVGLFITSTLSYAVVTFNTFTSGTAISSSQMNANFATIKTKLDELDVGFVGSIASNIAIACSAVSSYGTFPTDYSMIPMTADYNDGNFASNVYTIPTTGIYRFYFSATSDATMGYTASVDLSSDGGASWTQTIYGGMAAQNTVLKFNAGDKLRISAGCGTMASPATTANIDATKFMFAIKKF